MGIGVSATTELIIPGEAKGEFVTILSPSSEGDAALEGGEEALFNR